MTSKIINALLTFVGLFLTFGLGYVLGQSQLAPVSLVGPASNTPADAAEEFAPFWEVYGLVQREFFDQDIENEALVTGAINGLLGSLEDQNTRYLTPEEEAASRSSFQGEFEGIGAEVTSEDENIVIVSPFEGSPAAEAGLRPGDILRAADGVDLTGMDVGAAAALVRGPAGTDVLLTIERNGETFEVTITRDSIDLPSVTGELVADELAYIRINRFSARTDGELRDVATDLLRQDPAGVIVDLRLNPGGSLSTVTAVADEFLDDGVILTERYGNGAVETLRAEEGALFQDLPVVVLIDEGSASASEVLAGALRDQGRATLIGTTTFGKGTVQTWFNLSNGGGVRITTARWLTPDGTWVHEEGLSPDIYITRSEADPATPPEEIEDRQLNAAIDFLQGVSVESDPRPAEDS